MCFLKFIFLLLIPSYISGQCQPSISVSGEQNVCVGQNFTLTCQFACHGPENHVQLMKDQQIECSLESSNNSITLSMHVHSANKNHSGKYSCQTKSSGSKSMVNVIVKDCAFSSKYESTVNKTSSSPSNMHQSPAPSRILDPVLIWYILFKTAVFLIGSVIAVLCARSTKK